MEQIITAWTGRPQRAAERLERPLELADGTRTTVVVHRYPAQEENTQSEDPRRILMVHGFRGDHHGLQLIVDSLPEHEVFVPDLPGFGETAPVPGRRHSLRLYAEVVEALAEELGFDDGRRGPGDLLLGHSFGTLVTSALVAGRIRHGRGPGWAGLVLTAPISDDIFTGTLLPGAAGVELYYRASGLLPQRAGDALLRSRLALAVTNAAMAVHGDPQIGRYIREQHRLHFGSYLDRDALLETYRASSRHTVGEFAADLRLPTLLVSGAEDQLSTERGRRRLRDSLPSGRLEIVRKTGHLIHYERPAQVARAVRRFLREL